MRKELCMWIEIFKTGKHTDSSGSESSYSDESLGLIASKYNDKVQKSDAFAAPLVKGHPQSDSPAYGWVEKLAMRGKYLMAKVKDLTPGIIKDIKEGRYKKISVALYPDLMLRHVGLLGGQAPAVKGLAPVKFSEELEYSEFNYEGKKAIKESSENSKNMEYTELEEENAKIKAENAVLIKKGRLRDHREYCNSLINSDGGSILNPSQVDLMIDLMEAAHHLDSIETNEFAEDESYSEKLKEFAESFEGGNIFAEIEAPSPGTAITDEFEDRNVEEDKMDMHRKALEYQAAHPGISYEEAVMQVIQF
jgi:hypothetical protein